MKNCTGECLQGRAPCPTPEQCEGGDAPVDWIGWALTGLTLGFVALAVWAVLR